MFFSICVSVHVFSSFRSKTSNGSNNDKVLTDVTTYKDIVYIRDVTTDIHNTIDSWSQTCVFDSWNNDCLN